MLPLPAFGKDNTYDIRTILTKHAKMQVPFFILNSNMVIVGI